MTAHANIKSDVAFNFLKIITPLLFIWGEGRSEELSGVDSLLPPSGVRR